MADDQARFALEENMKSSVRKTVLITIPLLSTGLFAPMPAQDATQHGDLASGPMMAHYTVAAESAATTDGGVIPLQVALRVANPPAGRAVFGIPVWTPGSYRLRDFPHRIRDVHATGDGAELPVMRLHPSAWEVVTGDAREVVLRYRVDLEPRDRFMYAPEDRRCLTYEGPAVYMYVRGHLDIPCHVSFELPEGWEQASGLVPRDDGVFFAEDYDFLADCPVKIGRFQRFGFESHGARIELVLDAGEDLEFEHEAWLDNIRRLVDASGDMFGGLPVDRYVFLFTAMPRGGGGGLEHLNSTAIGVASRRLARDPATGMGTVAHEFFHLWNVKRLRPIELGPFDYDRPNRTTGLWVSEGITSYYTNVLLARAGLRDEASFWRSMARQIQVLESGPARHHTSSEMASLSVWDQQARDRRISYYNSGLVMGLLLDLEIRHATGNTRSLDDLMRALYQLCVDEGRGFRSEEVPMLATAISGVDMRPWFDRHVAGTVVPDYRRILAYAGMDYSADRQSTWNARGLRVDRGGRVLFADHAAMDRSGAIDPLRSGGLVVAVEGEAVEDFEAVQARIDAAAAAGRSSLRVEFRTATGDPRTVNADLEEVRRFRVTLRPAEDRSELQEAIARGIATGDPPHPTRAGTESR